MKVIVMLELRPVEKVVILEWPRRTTQAAGLTGVLSKPAPNDNGRMPPGFGTLECVDEDVQIVIRNFEVVAARRGVEDRRLSGT